MRVTNGATRSALRGRFGLLALGLLLGASIVVSVTPRAWAEDVAFAGDSPAARVEALDAAIRTDVDGAVAALAKLGSTSKSADADLAFLVEVAVTHKDRPIRLLSLGALRALDAARALAALRTRADGENQLPTVFAIEGIGHLGSHDDVSRLLELAASPDPLIAAAALRALPRLATKKDIDAIVDLSLGYENLRLADYGAWAILDLSKKTDSVVKLYEKIAKKKSDPRASRANSIVAMLGDNPPRAQKWGDELTAARDALLAAPKVVPIDARNARHREKVEDTIAWIKENSPCAYLTLRASAKILRMPGENVDGHMDLEKAEAWIPLGYAGQTEKQLAYHVTRVGSILFQHKVGNPSEGHRGWELAIFDSYDVCVAAKLYNAGPGGLPRKLFVEDILAKRPWDGS